MSATASQRADTAEQLRLLEADAAAWSRRQAQGGRDAALLDRDQLREVAGWLTAGARRDHAVSEIADAYLAASRAAAGRRWWPGRGSAGGALAILLILLILATPITLLSIVGFTAALIHKFN
jgi:hypothetical protein